MNILKNIIFFFLGFFYRKPKTTPTLHQNYTSDEDEVGEEDFYPIGHA